MSTNVNVLELVANASESGFEELALVEPAVYKLELDASKTKKDGVFVKGRVLEGPYQGKLIGCGQLTFNEKAIGIALQNLKGMGIDRDKVASVAALNPSSSTELAENIAKLVKGRVVNASIIYNEYLGEVRNQFDIGKIQLVQAPAEPALGGIPQMTAAAPAAVAPAPPVTSVPAPAAPVAPAPVAEAAPAPVAPAPVAATPAPVAPAPLTPVTAAPVAPVGDPGF